MSPRLSPATQHELARIGLLAELPGELLGRLAAAMEREQLAPGAGPEPRDDARFYVVLNGMLATGAPRRVLRPGDHFGDVAAAGLPLAPGAEVRAMTPSVVASCDAATFEELVRPLLARASGGQTP